MAGASLLEALLLLCRPGRGRDHLDRALALLRHADWPRFVRLALEAGVPGLAADGLEALGDRTVPGRVLRLLTAARLRAGLSNRAALDEVRRIRSGAERAGLPLVPIKGAALMTGRPYARIDLRAMTDVDLLVRRGDFPRAERLLSDLGYVPASRRPHALRHEHHVPYRREGGSGGEAPVELHWTPFYILYGDPALDEAVFGRLVRHTFEGEEHVLLDGEDSLLVLLCHLARHRFRGPLKTLLDVAWLIDRPGAEIRWDRFWERALALGARGAAGFGLALACGLLELPEPPGLPATGEMRRRALGLLCPPSAVATVEQPPSWQRTLIDFLLQDRATAGLRYLALKGAELAERRWGGRAPRWLLREGPRG